LSEQATLVGLSARNYNNIGNNNRNVNLNNQPSSTLGMTLACILRILFW
jgi:hypothetical protein